MKTTTFGLGGWKKPTPVWAAKLSSYLMLATVALFVLEGFIVDWSEFIPDPNRLIFESFINAVEKSLITLGTALRFFGEKDAQPINENMYGVPHDNG